MKKKLVKVSRKRNIAIIILIIVFCLSFSCILSAETLQKKDTDAQKEAMHFKDVIDSAWYYNSVKYLFDNKIISGMTSDTFAPNECITRAAFVKMVAVASKDDLSVYDGSTKFNDVKKDSWYAVYIQWAEKNNIISGVNQLEFKPQETISREAVAAILYRYMQKEGTLFDGLTISSFSDERKISSWAKEAVAALQKGGIIVGHNGAFNPQNPITRAEISQILFTFLTSGTADEITNGVSKKLELREGDKITYQKEEITDLDQLYNMARNSNSTLSSETDNKFKINKKSTVQPINNGESNLSSAEVEEVDSYEVTQHLQSIQKADGSIVDVYTTTVIGEVELGVLDVDPIKLSNSDYSQQEGYDSSSSARSYAKCTFAVGTQQISSQAMFHHIEIMQSLGAWRVLDGSVSMISQKLFGRTMGQLYDRSPIDLAYGPIMATGQYTVYHTPTIAQAPRVWETGLHYDLRTSAVSTLKRGSYTWSFTTTAGVTGNGVTWPVPGKYGYVTNN